MYPSDGKILHDILKAVEQEYRYKTQVYNMKGLGYLFAFSSSLPSLWAFAPHRTISKHHVNMPGRVKDMKLYMGWFDKTASKKSKESTKSSKNIHILDNIGSGSYGTVHLATFTGDDGKLFVAKRAWTLKELKARPASTHREDDKPVIDDKALKGRAERCNYYLDIEQHCLSKISSEATREVRAPKFVGKYRDDSDKKDDWLLFEMITRNKDDKSVAKTLKELMDLDWISQHRQDDGGKNQNHHLYLVHKELGLDESATFDDTLDVVLLGLLKAIVGVHELNIVHRDFKPDNLIVDGEKKDFMLIDFGSAQDIDVLKKMIFVLDGEASVALSPIYAAPECFIDWDK